ncbi:MAG TPA: aminotransferase class I/II-fold pyridoxal phosphate-dependent enzyme [Symbiobacteriaceae bacterium]|nr:aminotransferase class I/II-fold pyridoxal phosphate-dependent enzyme [Symbiobacteriaceae bacterium]
MNKPQRLQSLAAAVFATMDEARKRVLAAGTDVINLSIGSPDLPPAPHVTEAMIKGIRNPGNYGYPMRDLPAFREAVAAWYQGRFGVTLNPDTEVLGLMGSQEGLAHIAQAVTDPGDLVLVPDPGYPIYTAGPVLAGAQLYPVPVLAENGFLPDLEALPDEVKQRAKLLILNYPSNPAAAVVKPGFFEQVVGFARRHGVAVLHDAAYSELTFDGYRPPSFLETPGAMEVGLEFNSLSKTFNLAGARVAYAVGNAKLIGALREVKAHLDYGIFRPIQEAAVAALTGPQDSVAAMAATYQRRRDVLVDGLTRAGWAIPRPKATMFCWAPIPLGFGSSLAFAMELLQETGVTIVPGSGFGAQGEGYVRIALVQSEERLAEAVERIGRSSLLGR